jgi:hypothetical protein
MECATGYSKGESLRLRRELASGEEETRRGRKEKEEW